MTAWKALYEQHRSVRSVSNLDSLLRLRLLKLAERGHCPETIRGRFTRRDRGPLRELYIQTDRPGIEGEPLVGLPALQDGARLTVLALTSRRIDHLHQFTAMVAGTTLRGAPWVAAIHLEDDSGSEASDRRGSGACAHAAYHCHVGPTLNDHPKVRVPFPAVSAADALDWLLSAVVPNWEPAPWPDVWPHEQTR